MRRIRSLDEHRQEADRRPRSTAEVAVVLDRVRSAHNVGSILRTCDGFGVSEVHLTGFTPAPPHPDIEKTALGAEDTIDWIHRPDLGLSLVRLADAGFRIVGVEQTTDSVSLYEADLSSPIAFVFGHEVEGLSRAALSACDSVVEIPMLGQKHSFNIAVACGIVLSEQTRRRTGRPPTAHP